MNQDQSVHQIRFGSDSLAKHIYGYWFQSSFCGSGKRSYYGSAGYWLLVHSQVLMCRSWPCQRAVGEKNLFLTMSSSTNNEDCYGNKDRLRCEGMSVHRQPRHQ